MGNVGRPAHRFQELQEKLGDTPASEYIDELRHEFQTGKTVSQLAGMIYDRCGIWVAEGTLRYWLEVK